MNKMNNKILQIAQKNLEQAPFNLEIEVKELCVKNSQQIDAQVKLLLPDRVLAFQAEIKAEVRVHQLPRIYEMAKTNAPFLLIGGEIFPDIKDKLKEHGINWIDGAGNMCIKGKDHLIFIDHNKPVRAKTKKDRAFTKTGLKVIFLFLQDEMWLQNTYREIAEAADVALGTIGYVMNGLKKKRYLVKKDEKRYQIVRKKDLLDDWMTAFETELKPKLHKGNFTFIDDDLAQNWKNLELDDYTVWGGETAGALLTDMLKPQILTLYTRHNKGKIMKNFNLKPDPDGNVHVYEPYWKVKAGQKTAPPLTVYTDLMLTGDERNFNIAKKVNEQFIQN